MKTSITAGVSALAVLVALLVGGCQTSGHMMTGMTSEVCPTCSNQLRAVSVAGVYKTKCVCPSCKTVSAIDPFAPDSVRDYVGEEASTVHVCDVCGALVEKCPVCRAK